MCLQSVCSRWSLLCHVVTHPWGLIYTPGIVSPAHVNELNSVPAKHTLLSLRLPFNWCYSIIDVVNILVRFFCFVVVQGLLGRARDRTFKIYLSSYKWIYFFFLKFL